MLIRLDFDPQDNSCDRCPSKFLSLSLPPQMRLSQGSLPFRKLMAIDEFLNGPGFDGTSLKTDEGEQLLAKECLLLSGEMAFRCCRRIQTPLKLLAAMDDIFPLDPYPSPLRLLMNAIPPSPFSNGNRPWERVVCVPSLQN
ncbi:hypothetical protein CDAR_599191 [Caerostris darwini]|uniref:Uncharacterized protein n=1 Tax=Caerostris darwini TaxID=1538125 RepID=A0AAV4R4H0_9ARAC|nr:hypothetical protein CDAR_599191 [Caerostris darwini]